MAGKSYQIPFKNNSKGELQMMEWTYATEGQVAGSGQGNDWRYPDLWRKNDEFDATVKMVGHHRGRSAARVTVQNLLNNELYSMGFGSFFEAVETLGVVNGTLRGRWRFKKQGTNYGLVVVG